MIARTHSKLLENIWLPNGPETVMVSLSSHVGPAHTKPQSTRPNARTAVCQGEGFPRFSEHSTVQASHAAQRSKRLAAMPLPPLRCVRGSDTDALVLILSGNGSIVKIRPR